MRHRARCHALVYGLLLCGAVACVRPPAAPARVGPAPRVVQCRQAPATPDDDPLTCGLRVGVAAGAVCEDVSLAPRRMRGAFLQGVSIRLRDSSIVVGEVSLDTVDDNLVVSSDPCGKPLQHIARDWRYLPQTDASAVFKGVLQVLQRGRSAPFTTCVLDSRPSPARRSTVYVVVDDAAVRRIAVLSQDQETVPSRNSFVQFTVNARDSVHPDIQIVGRQRIAPCQEALRLAESFVPQY